MLHTWKCPNGHENVTEIHDQARLGPPRQYVVDCRAQGCTARAWIDVGAAPSPPPQTKRAALKEA
jgi:hypothetical protein